MRYNLYKVSQLVSVLGLVLALKACQAYRGSQSKDMIDNQELMQMVAKDQAIRQNDTIQFEPVDRIHRQKVMSLLANGLVKTNQDKLNAALILQHTALSYCEGKLVSISPENYFLAYQLAKSVFETNEPKVGNMVAITYDRFLLYTEGYQKYGTQKVFDEKKNKMLWAPIHPQTSDAERAKYYVKPLKELLKECEMQAFE